MHSVSVSLNLSSLSGTSFHYFSPANMWQTLMLIFADIRLYVLTHGHTGWGHQQRECSDSSNTLATNQTSTRWEGTNCTGYCYCMILCCSSRTRKYLFSPSVSWNIFFSISSYFLRTKIFIRHPRTLFATEDAFEICKHELGKAPVTSDKRRLAFPEGVVMILAMPALTWLVGVSNLFCYSHKNPGQIQRL